MRNITNIFIKVIVIWYICSVSAGASEGYLHSPELDGLLHKHFSYNKTVFTKDIELPSFNQKEVFKSHNPNRHDRFNVTFPFVLKTKIKNIEKFAIFIIPGWDGVADEYEYKFMKREAFIAEGKNIENLNLMTTLQFSINSAIYFVALADEVLYVNSKLFPEPGRAYNFRNDDMLIGRSDREIVQPIIKWSKYGSKGILFDQIKFGMRGKIKSDAIKLNFRTNWSNNGYHYRPSYYSNDYEIPIASYVNKLKISDGKEIDLKFSFGPYSTSRDNFMSRLSLKIPRQQYQPGDLIASWSDNHGFKYYKQFTPLVNRQLKSSETKVNSIFEKLYLAIKTGNNEAVKQIVESGFDIDVVFPNNLTPLAVALLKRNNTILKILLESGFDVNKPFLYGLTPLMWAVASFNIEAVELLMKAGASPVQQDDEGLTALDRVFYFYKARGYNEPHQTQPNKRKLVKLLTMKAQYFDDDSFYRLVKKTISVDYYNLMRDFVDAGIPANFGNGIVLRYFVEGLIFDYAEKLIERGADVEIIDEQGKSIYQHISEKLKRCKDNNSYIYSSSYCVMLEEEFPQLEVLLNKRQSIPKVINLKENQSSDGVGLPECDPAVMY